MEKRKKIVIEPSYGKAPAWLVQLSTEKVEQIYACVDAGYSLSSGQVIREKKQVELLLRRIYEENQRLSGLAG